MNIYVGLFLLFIALFVAYRVIKIRNQFRQSVTREQQVMQYYATGIKSWPSVAAILDSVEVQNSNAQTDKFTLATKLTFTINNQQYSCTQSPYSVLTTSAKSAAMSLRDDIINSDEYAVYYNPVDTKESFYVFNGFLSWSDYERLLKRPD
ncbi:MAG TPA: hypothetical protein VLC79_03460 [Cellvibrio sp.]|nr:hypothetical protein [Cellvibrio sp.]